jgi:murein L,D-transpeptidase YcbB/YkuD
VDSGRNADLRWSDFTPYKAEVAKLYETNGYSLLWVQNGRARPQGLAVIELLQHADAKGLDPEDYDGSRWQGRLLKLGQTKLDQKPSEQDLASFDTALTVSTALPPCHPLRPRKPQGIQVSARYGMGTTLI